MQNNTGLRLINTTSNTIEIDLLEQGQTGANVPVASVLAQTLVVADVVSLLPNPFLRYYVQNVDIATLSANLNTRYNISSDDVIINTTFNNRAVGYTVGLPDVLSASNPLSLLDVCNEIKTLFEIRVGVINSVSVTANCTIEYNGANYILNTIFNVFYLVDTSTLSTLISYINIKDVVGIFPQSFPIPTSPSPISGTWSTTYATASGGQVVNLNGVGYGELLNSQTGEVLAINSMTIQPYSSPTFTFNKQISQLLEPFVFNKRLAWGESRVFVLNPIVDLNQESPTLKNISLEDRTNEFIFDGTTRLTYRLLPFATINVQFNYTKLTNFVFGRPELVKYVVEQNIKRNKKEDYLNNIAKEYTLIIDNNK